MEEKSSDKQSSGSSGRLLFGALFGLAAFIYLNSNLFTVAAIAVFLKVNFETAKLISVCVAAVIGYFISEIFGFFVIFTMIVMIGSWLRSG